MNNISWQDIVQEVNAVKPQDLPPGQSPLDYVRRKYYSEPVELTKRPLIVYSSAFHFQPKAIFGNLMSIDLSDKDGFVEVTRNIEGPGVDIFIHSPGGFAEATESIVDIVRSKFTDVRFIVTGTAKSAATMLAMSGNSILMSEAGELGPIDPQVRIDGRFSPAGSILEEFDKAVKDIKANPSNFNSWVPILRQYGPSLLVECENFITLSKSLVKNWLATYMFDGESQAKRRAGIVSKFLADEKKSLSHARRIDADQLHQLGVKVSRIEQESQGVQEQLRKVHLVIMMTLEMTNAIKIFENSSGAALIRQAQAGPMPLSQVPN